MAPLSYEDALAAVGELDRKFTAKDLAAKLGCTTTNLRYHGWLERLVEEGELGQSGTRPVIYRRRRLPENRQKGLTYGSARTAAAQLRHHQPFTQRELAEKMGCSEQNVSMHNWIDRLVADDIIKYVGKRTGGRRPGSGARQYEYIPAPESKVERRKEPPPETLLIGNDKIGTNGSAPSGRKRKKSRTREMQKLVVLAEEQGWTVERTKKNHLRFLPPPGTGGEPCIGPSTPSDWRSVKNMRSLLARNGLELDPGKVPA